ncbi:MAG: S26 family signal peptidase [Synergistaceae bacterium]|nr:S26 family signal peptidase [Synergistaceae bacterium]
MKIIINKTRILLFLKLCSILCIIALVLTVLYVQGYRINLTASLPQLIFRFYDVNVKPVSRGDYVVVDCFLINDNPAIKTAIERKYLSRIPLVKQVGAVSGDLISLLDNRIYINGEDHGPMIVLSEDSEGNPLSPFPTPVTLQTGQFWLVSNPERGYDSRYFGWIDRNCITNLAYPVF